MGWNGRSARKFGGFCTLVLIVKYPPAQVSFGAERTRVTSSVRQLSPVILIR